MLVMNSAKASNGDGAESVRCATTATSVSCRSTAQRRCFGVVGSTSTGCLLQAVNRASVGAVSSVSIGTWPMSLDKSTRPLYFTHPRLFVKCRQRRADGVFCRGARQESWPRSA
jgi:hypothetical protein